MVKPIKREELRINILLALSNKNRSKQENERLELSDTCYYDIKNEIIFINEEAIRLSKNEKKLLKLLIENDNQLVQFSTIKDEIWLKPNLSESSVRTLIYRLRKKLNSSLEIETIPSIGCKLFVK